MATGEGVGVGEVREGDTVPGAGVIGTLFPHPARSPQSTRLEAIAGSPAHCDAGTVCLVRMRFVVKS